MGGKSSPPPPDYGPLAQASKEAAEIMAGLGREQLAFAKEQYGELKPLAQQIASGQIAAQQEQLRQARDYYDYQTGTFRPLEQGIVRQAQEFSTEGYREGLAREAAAAAGRAFGTTQGMTQRALAARGVNPASGAALAAANQNTLGLAAQRAGAMTGARQQAEQMGWARQLDAAGLGRGLAGASTAAYSGATGAGSAGMQTSMAPGTQYMQGMGQGASTIGSGLGMQMQGLGNIVNSQTSMYNAGLSQQGLDVGGLLQGGAAMYTAFSDRRLKQDIEVVGRDERTGLALYEFAYTDDPSKRYIGVMADEVEEIMPQAVIQDSNGFKMVNYGMLGIEMVEV